MAQQYLNESGAFWFLCCHSLGFGPTRHIFGFYVVGVINLWYVMPTFRLRASQLVYSEVQCLPG